MSFNNHDADDVNGKKYGNPKNTQFTKEDELNGRAIKIYLEATTKPLKDFMVWYRTFEKSSHE